MGGFAGAVGDLVGGAAEKLFGKSAGETAEAGVFRGVFKEADSFAQHPYAAKIYDDYQKVYRPALEKASSQIGEQSQKAGVAKSQAMIAREAHQMASDSTFGKNQVRIQSMLKAAKTQKSVAYANTLSDNLNVMFKSNQIQEGPAAGLSTFDVNMRRATKDAAGNKIEGFETPPSKYRGRHAAEDATSGMRATLAFKAAPVHAATALLNVASDAGLGNLAKTLGTIWGPGREAAIAQLKSSNAISEFTLDEMKQHEAFTKGFISKYAPGSAGEFIHRNMYIPGMHAVRRESLLFAAQSGKYMAQEAAERLKVGDEKFALPAMKQLGLDANKIKRNNFQLDPDDISKAFYHGANNRVFLNPYDKTPSFWRQSPLWRSVNAFHGYVQSQSTFERQLIQRQWAQGDFIGIARNLAFKALVYPNVGAALYEFDRYLGGEDHDNPMQHLGLREEYTPSGQIYDAIIGKNAAKAVARTSLNTLNTLARIGVWGSTSGYSHPRLTSA
jgi:hypothetical protein